MMMMMVMAIRLEVVMAIIIIMEMVMMMIIINSIVYIIQKSNVQSNHRQFNTLLKLNIYILNIAM